MEGDAGSAVDPEQQPLCPACGTFIGVNASIGGTRERMLHLDCWLREREDSRRAPGTQEPV
jgi:hypothetical protein